MEELLRTIPEAFVFEDQGKEGESERVAFHPNPGFKPKTYEQRIVHALDGIVFIDLHDKVIARLSGSLGSRVEFGYGLMGHIEPGGTTEITRVQLAPGVLENARGKTRHRWTIRKYSKQSVSTKTKLELVLSR